MVVGGDLPFTLTEFDLVITLVLTIIGGVGTFLIALWYWGLDRQTENYDEKLRSDIQTESAFSGIRKTAQAKFIATSPAVPSRIVSMIKKILGRPRSKPAKIVPVDGDSIDKRKIEMIRERVRPIPGRNILGQEMVGALRNQYAYKLALSTDGVDSDIVEYFKTNLESYDHSEKVLELAKSDNYSDIILIQFNDGGHDKDPLNDVFLPLVESAEKYCIQSQSGPDPTHEEIERCKKILMPAFFGLWAQRVVGVEVHEDLSEDECLTNYRRNIRESENWGYWMLSAAKCDESEFRRLRHLAWSINQILEEHWTDDPYLILHPHGESLRGMDFVPEPFALFQKEEQVVRGGASEGSN